MFIHNFGKSFNNKINPKTRCYINRTSLPTQIISKKQHFFFFVTEQHFSFSAHLTYKNTMGVTKTQLAFLVLVVFVTFLSNHNVLAAGMFNFLFSYYKTNLDHFKSNS